MAVIFFAWPTHKESFTITLDIHGHGEYIFSKPFKNIPNCVFNFKPIGKAITNAKIELWSNPNTSISGTCK